MNEKRIKNKDRLMSSDKAKITNQTFFTQTENREEEKKVNKFFKLDESVAEAIRIMAFEEKTKISTMANNLFLKAIPKDFLQKAKEYIKKG